MPEVESEGVRGEQGEGVRGEQGEGVRGEAGEGVRGEDSEGVRGEQGDEDYAMKEGEEEDETTIQEQERHEQEGGEGNHQTEIDELNEESWCCTHTHSTLSCINTLSLSTDELSLEELLALYDLERHSTSPDTTLESSSKPDTSVLGQTHCEHCVCL